MQPPGILFLCVANSARSQIAEGLARARFGDKARVASAGSSPTVVRPQAIQALADRGINASGHTSTSVDDVDPSTIDLVITLCTEEVCPAFLGDAERWHWPIDDPAGASPDAAKELAAFRDARDAIATKLDDLDTWLASRPG